MRIGNFFYPDKLRGVTETCKTPVVCLPTCERLSLRLRLMLLNLVRKMNFVIRSPFLPPFADEGLNAIELTKFICRFRGSTSRGRRFDFEVTVWSLICFRPRMMT